MDPKVMRGLVVLLALVLYFAGAKVGGEMGQYAHEAAMLLVGVAVFKRPGDKVGK
jgi:hypothetical protein